MEYGGQSSLITPYTTIEFNTNLGNGAMYVHNAENCTGLDGDTVRAAVEDKSQTTGGIVHETLGGPRHIVLNGWICTDDGLSGLAARAQKNTMIRNLQLALRSLRETDEYGTYSWTVYGVGDFSLEVRNDIGLTVTGGMLKAYNFGLVAPNPDY